MLITEKVEVTLNSYTIKYYEDLGYIIPRTKNKYRKFTVPQGTKIIVKVKDLSRGSHVMVNVKCDCKDCKNPYLKPMKWQDYLEYLRDGKSYCKACAIKLFAAESSRKSIRQKGMSLNEWCLKNDRQDIINRWDDKLNDCSMSEINYTSKGIEGKGYWFKCLDHPEHGSELKNISSLVGGKQKTISCTKCKTVSLTHPELIKYFINKEDADTYIYALSRKIKMKCPNCGHIKTIEPYRILNQGFGCPRCSDGVSYPEKFMFSMLEQMNLAFIVQLSKITFDWCKDYRYDFYIPSINGILEANGIQHYEENKNWKISLKETQENDQSKHRLAEENNIENYIKINCRKSQLEFIKDNILNSSLNSLFDLSNVNWLKCHEFACKSLVKIVCNLWCDGIKNPVELGRLLKLAETTTRTYLKQGNKLGWCQYDVTEQGTRKVICITTGKKFDNIVEGVKEYRIYKCTDSQIIKCCKGKAHSAGKLEDGTKLVWMYYEDYLEQQSKNNIQEAI